MAANPSYDKVTWKFAPYSWQEAEKLAQQLRVPFIVASVLASRGLGNPEQARLFLECPNQVPDPFLFGHMQAVAKILSAAIAESRRVVVHGDYDADGITATALLVLGLRELGLEAEWYLPSRFEEGYGLSRAAVEQIARGGPGLLITVDCGVNYCDEIALAKNLGLDVIVIDHHEPGSQLPACHLIHPVAGSYPTSDLCGVGLAFKVLHGLYVQEYNAPRCAVPDILHQYLDLVAVGTIADQAPLLGENRYYVKEGLKLLSLGSRTGLQALANICGCTGRVDAGAVAYRLAPRLNAAGRLRDAVLPLELLLSTDDHEAADISQKLHELNAARQEVEKRIFTEAVAQVEERPALPPILVLGGKDWHQGVVGIVASRLVERYHRPVILLSIKDDVAKGSGRSIPAYNLVSALNASAPLLTVYGGHAMAAGLTLPTANLQQFREALERHAGETLSSADLLPVYKADAILRGEDINADTAAALDSLAPFGNGNPRPRLVMVDAQIIQPEVTRGGEHLRCLVEVEGVRAKAIGFGLGNSLPQVQAQTSRRALGVRLCLSEWQGVLRPELLLDNIGEPAGLQDWIPSNKPEHGLPIIAQQPTPVASPQVFPASDLATNAKAIGALAQILTSGESVVLLVCSLPHSVPELSTRLPLCDLAGGQFACLGKGYTQSPDISAAGARVLIAEWDTLMKNPEVLLTRPLHAVAVDPPYRQAHKALLDRLRRRGTHVHLLYGDSERTRTARLLRYLVHPRFAMVCVYRALLRGARGAEVHTAAAGLAWEQSHIVLTDEDLQRASRVLDALGLGQPYAGTAKIEASIVPLYADAEAEYEECSRLCRIL